MSSFEKELKEQQERHRIALAESNKLLEPPADLTDEERAAWEYIATILTEGTSYIKKPADAELVRQYVQFKLMRDHAWTEWNKRPEKYIRIVTGICSDGKTPKVVIKENEHYKIFSDCNKRLEKLLTELKLTPNTRSKIR